MKERKQKKSKVNRTILKNLLEKYRFFKKKNCRSGGKTKFDSEKNGWEIICLANYGLISPKTVHD